MGVGVGEGCGSSFRPGGCASLAGAGACARASFAFTALRRRSCFWRNLSTRMGSRESTARDLSVVSQSICWRSISYRGHSSMRWRTLSTAAPQAQAGESSAPMRWRYSAVTGLAGVQLRQHALLPAPQAGRVARCRPLGGFPPVGVALHRAPLLVARAGAQPAVGDAQADGRAVAGAARVFGGSLRLVVGPLVPFEVDVARDPRDRDVRAGVRARHGLHRRPHPLTQDGPLARTRSARSTGAAGTSSSTRTARSSAAARPREASATPTPRSCTGCASRWSTSPLQAAATPSPRGRSCAS